MPVISGKHDAEREFTMTKEEESEIPTRLRRNVPRDTLLIDYCSPICDIRGTVIEDLNVSSRTENEELLYRWSCKLQRGKRSIRACCQALSFA